MSPRTYPSLHLVLRVREGSHICPCEMRYIRCISWYMERICLEMLKNVRICEAQTVFEIFVGFVGLHYKGVYSSALPRLFSLVILLKIVEEKALGTRLRVTGKFPSATQARGTPRQNVCACVIFGHFRFTRAVRFFVVRLAVFKSLLLWISSHR